MDKTMICGDNVEGAAAAVAELMGDQTAHSRTVETVAMVYMDGRTSTTNLQNVVCSEFRSLKDNISEQRDAIVANTLGVDALQAKQAEQDNVQAEQTKALTEQAKALEKQADVQAGQAKALEELKGSIGSPGASVSNNHHLFATDMGSLVSPNIWSIPLC